jgi:diguanylate cyclase (GGDEF)-like protein
MTNDGIRATVITLRRLLLSVNAAVPILAAGTIIIGLFLDLSVGQITLALMILGAIFVVLWKKGVFWWWSGTRGNKQTEVYHHPPEGSMKTLLFDDYQSSSEGKYVVKEVQDEQVVIPSTKAMAPAPVGKKEAKAREFQISDFVDLETNHTDLEPRSEFQMLLTKTLTGLREVLFAHSVMFFWVNGEKGQLVIEAKVTDSQNFVTAKRLGLERDIVSQVARNCKPQFHGRITPVMEKELVRHYDSTEYIKSVIAVPVFYPGERLQVSPVGVLAADSKAEDAFGPETLDLLSNFTKLVSALIKSYTGKYDLLLDSELLTSLRRMQDRIKADPTEYSVLSALSEEVHRLLNWDFLAVTMYVEEKQGWVLQKVVNKGGETYVGPDQALDFGRSLVGQVIRENRLEVVDDWTVTRPVRFCEGESILSEGSFVCVPISSFNRCYGALSLESRNKKNFSGNEVETLYRLVENAAGALEVIYMNDLVKEYVIVDQVTGSFNRRHFLRKLEQEVQRATDFGNDLALATIIVDDAQEIANRHGKEGYKTVLNQVARILRSSIRPYDVIGRLDDDALGVALVDTPASDGYLWAEKMRKQIASHIISMGSTSFSVTISAGVCGLMDGMHKDELLTGTSQVLHKAVEGGGNLVRVF